MVAKIIIKRRFRSGCQSEILNLLLDLRAAAMSQPGYLSGVTLTKYDDPQVLTVIGTWENMENWHEWKKSRKRQELDAMLAVYEDGPAIYEEYILGYNVE